MPLQMGYGGSPFNVTLPSGSFNSSQQLSTAKCVQRSSTKLTAQARAHSHRLYVVAVGVA